MQNLLAPLPAFLVLLTPVSAGQLDVGPPGSGAPYGDLATAIAAAAPGDTICVQPGTYFNEFTVDKPLSILAAGSGQVFVKPGVVQNLAAGQTVVLSGMTIERVYYIYPPYGAPLQLANNAGTVVLHDLTLQSITQVSGVDPTPIQALRVEGTSRVLILDCQLLGEASDPALHADGSSVWISDSAVVAQDGTIFSPGGGPGARLIDSSLCVSRSSLAGGIGSFDFPPLSIGGPGGPGVTADNSSIVIAGGTANLVQGGDAHPGGTYPGGSALVLTNGSSAVTAADVTLAGGFDGAGAIQAPATDVDMTSTYSSIANTIPTVTISPPQAVPGAVFSIQSEGTPSGVYLLYLATSLGPPLQLPSPIGTIHLHVPTGIRLGSFWSFDGAGQSTLTFPLPNQAALVGTTAYFQIVETTAGFTYISDPALLAIVP